MKCTVRLFRFVCEPSTRMLDWQVVSQRLSRYNEFPVGTEHFLLYGYEGGRDHQVAGDRPTVDSGLFTVNQSHAPATYKSIGALRQGNRLPPCSTAATPANGFNF